MHRYGLLGYPLSHSFSKRYFTKKFEKKRINSTYENFEIDNIAKFQEIVKNNPDINGFNVTLPYKQQIIPYLDDLNDAAQEIGAVNTIKVVRKGNNISLEGFNTDIYGFEFSLKPLLKNYHKRALILGNGGASKAVKYVLGKLGIDFISASRREILEKDEISYSNINKKIMQEQLLIINTTPLGTYPNVDTFPDIPYEFITEKHLLFDLVYNPEITSFMKKGKSRGATVKNGYEMLEQQAEKAYEIWNS